MGVRNQANTYSSHIHKSMPVILLLVVLAAVLSEYLGRKYSTVVGAVVFVAGGIVQAAAFQLW